MAATTMRSRLAEGAWLALASVLVLTASSLTVLLVLTPLSDELLGAAPLRVGVIALGLAALLILAFAPAPRTPTGRES